MDPEISVFSTSYSPWLDLCWPPCCYGRAWHGVDKGLTCSSVRLRIPILIVPNDLSFLAVIAPLSLVLLYREPRGVMSIFAAASIFLSLCTICIFRSRTAAVTMIVSLICATALIYPRRRLLVGMAGVLGTLVLALLFNALVFPETQLVTKVIHRWGSMGRSSYWVTAWNMFLEAPLLGHGPHTFGLFHKTPWIHNLYLEVLAEQGILGFAALGTLIGYGFFAAWQIQRTGTAEARLLVAGTLAGLIGFCCAGGTELSLLREWAVTTLFMLLGVVGNLSALQTHQERTSS